MARVIDLTGQKIGKLTVLQRVENTKQGQTRWLCQCDCGEQTIVHGQNLRYGKTQSCGCNRRIAPVIAHTTHGGRHTRIYKKWVAIKSRCYNEKATGYKYYGGRGITMCDRWRDSFEAFYEDVSTLPHFEEEGYSLDRVNNDGNYEPNNVRWASVEEQQNNKRSNHLLTYGEQTQTIAQWAKEIGCDQRTLCNRLWRGWSVEKALFTPITREERKNEGT